MHMEVREMKIFKFFIVAALTLGGGAANSADYAMYVTIPKVINYADGTVGNCAMELSPITAIEDQTDISHGTGVGECKVGFLSMDCLGTYYSKSAAAGFANAASLALVTGNQVYVEIDPTKKHGGYCVARRVDNLNN